MASKLELQVIARDQASKVLKGIRGDIKDLGSAAGNSRGALSQMFSVAGGDVLARLHQARVRSGDVIAQGVD